DERSECRRIQSVRPVVAEKGRAHPGPGEGREGVAGDAMRSTLGGDDPREARHAGLGRRIRGRAGVDVIETGARCRVEDASAPPGGAHGGEGGAGAGEGPGQVDAYDPDPRILRELGEGMALCDARVVDQDVQAAEGLEGRTDDRLAG